MHATKETCIIAYACLAGAWILTARGRILNDLRQGHGMHNRFALLVLGAVTAALVSVVLFSSFFSHARGPLDSLLAYLPYLDRGSGIRTEHTSAWYYYLRMLAGIRYPGGPFWSEAFILILALAGFASLADRSAPQPGRQLRRFLAWYAILIAAFYSAIAYKTPWCVLSILHALILMAGIGAAALWSRAHSRPRARRSLLLLAAGCAHLAVQVRRANFTFYAPTCVTPTCMPTPPRIS
jgi:predicted membrane-bound mannosyltransferase